MNKKKVIFLNENPTKTGAGGDNTIIIVINGSFKKKKDYILKNCFFFYGKGTVSGVLGLPRFDLSVLTKPVGAFVKIKSTRTTGVL